MRKHYSGKFTESWGEFFSDFFEIFSFSDKDLVLPLKTCKFARSFTLENVRKHVIYTLENVK